MTGATLNDGTYTYAASYDDDLRLTARSYAANGTLLYQTQPGYDAVGNVTSVATTLPAGTDNQAFCYDEQNRLTWATSQSATGPCGAHNTAGTLTSAAYTQSFAYDVLDRLTSGPGGSYTYGVWAQHLHAVTAIGTAYTASYDAAGDLVCRAPTSGTSCASSPTTGALYR